MIVKPGKWGGPDQLGAVAPWRKKFTLFEVESPVSTCKCLTFSYIFVNPMPELSSVFFIVTVALIPKADSDSVSICIRKIGEVPSVKTGICHSPLRTW